MNNDGVLATPERNHFFYGKLMDVVQFEKEQHYFNRKRWLLNRLGLGSGVVCGLEVAVDPEAEGMIQIQPGVAIDGLGREIIVPETVVVNPGRLTDDTGNPAGDPIGAGTVTICLAYAETQTDPVPVFVPDCDTPDNCACSTIREGFHVLVRRAEDDAPQPPSCELGPFPLPMNGDLHAILCRRVNALCPEAPADPCVPLARITLPLNGDSIDSCTARRLVYGNALLYEMLMCLVERLEGMFRGRILRYFYGDGQTGLPGDQLRRPLVVQLIDTDGSPISGEFIQFEVTAGNGRINPRYYRTNQQGRVYTRWTLGPAEGRQLVTANAVGTALTVTFRATGIQNPS